MVFSAFYESRLEADGPAIRIIAIGFQEAYNNIGALYCQLWYEDRNIPLVTPALYDIIYRSTLHPDSWCSHFIICKLPEDEATLPV